MTMTDQQVETTEQPSTEAVEPLQEAVNSTEEAAVQESQEQIEQPANKTPEWVQRRFNEMTRDKHEAQRKADAALEEAATYRRLMESMRTGEQPETQQPAAKPPVNDDQRIREEAQRLNQQERFNQRSNDVYSTGTAEYPDFDAALQNLGMLGATPQFFQEIVSLEDAHKVLHALGSNPEEAGRILALPPLQQGRELERLASKPKAAAPKKPVSQAPAPISTLVDGNGSAPIDLEKASIDDFMKARNNRPR